MSSLAASASESELDKVAEGTPGRGGGKEDKEKRRRSMESPLVRPGMRRSGTLPVFPRVNEVATPTKGMDLPYNPKDWTPAELARYLTHTLRTGGPDGSGQILPQPLVKDIETWVLRHRMDGRAFLKGNQESWSSSSRPPPFLPLLLSISRRLRRTSLQSRISADNTTFSPSPLISDSPRTGSILMEEDEEGSGDESPISGVRRLANTFESGSTNTNIIADTTDLEPLKPQWTGGSSTSEVWRRWEDLGVGVRRKRRISERSGGAGSIADEEGSARSLSSGSRSGSAEPEIETPGIEEEESEDMGGTVKAPPPGLGIGVIGLGISTGDSAASLGVKQTSPPPPYRSPDPDQSPAHLPIPMESVVDTPPNRMRLSVTPTPDRPLGLSARFNELADDEAEEESSPDAPNETESDDGAVSHMDNMTTHRRSGSNPYAALRRTSLSGRSKSTRRGPSALGEDSMGGSDQDMSGTRRVTIRPNYIDSIFAPVSPIRAGPSRSARETELEEQLSLLVNRVKELETKLDSVSNDLPHGKDQASSISRSKSMNASLRISSDLAEAIVGHGKAKERENGISRPASPIGMLPDSILTRLGLMPEREGLPTRMRELPAYLFLVGVGVGAVVVRVFMRRR